MQIKVCRVIGIFFMMYVHVNPGLDSTDLSNMSGPLPLVDLVLVGFLGRASVPALSVISGFLIVPALRKYSLSLLVRERFLTLIVPMVFWNVLIIALSIAVSLVIGTDRGFVPGLDQLNPWQVIAFKVLSLNDDSVTVSLKFLRDLFVCVVFSEAILWGVRKGGWLFVALIWTEGLCFGFAPVVHRPHILMFFVFGVQLAHRFGHLSPSRKLVAAVIVMTLAHEIAWQLGWKAAQPIEETARRLEFSLLILFVSLWLARSPWCRTITRLEPAIFFVFLGHMTFFLVLWGVWQAAFGRSVNFPYILFFLAAPVIWLAVAIVLYPLLLTLPTWAQVLVKGKGSNRGGAADSQLIAPTAPAPLGQQPER